MSPTNPYDWASTTVGTARQQEYDRSADAMRQDIERAGRAQARQQQEAQAGRSYRSRLPYMTPVNPRAAASAEDLPSVMQPHQASPDVSPKSRPDEQARTSSLQMRWPKQKKEPNAPQKYVPATPHDPSHYRLAPIRETPISPPLQPQLYGLRVHVEQDPQQQYQTFLFDMQFKVRMAPGMPRQDAQ